jgi:hypothetical protein
VKKVLLARCAHGNDAPLPAEYGIIAWCFPCGCQLRKTGEFGYAFEELGEGGE